MELEEQKTLLQEHDLAVKNAIETLHGIAEKLVCLGMDRPASSMIEAAYDLKKTKGYPAKVAEARLDAEIKHQGGMMNNLVKAMIGTTEGGTKR